MPPAAVTPALPPIVVADQGDACGILRDSIGSSLPLVAAGSFEAARRLVGPDTPLVLCDCHFDDGRMYDLLRWMKGSAALASVPFMAIRVREGELDDAMYESVKIATDALGADGFVDVYRWRMRYGPEQAAQRLAQRIHALVDGTPDAPDSV